jgi:uncharacterized protein YlxP (DUF503 family)
MATIDEARLSILDTMDTAKASIKTVCDSFKQCDATIAKMAEFIKKKDLVNEYQEFVKGQPENKQAAKQKPGGKRGRNNK